MRGWSYDEVGAPKLYRVLSPGPMWLGLVGGRCWRAGDEAVGHGSALVSVALDGSNVVRVCFDSI